MLHFPHYVPNHVLIGNSLTQYYGPVWPADNIELIEMNNLSQYSLIHDSALHHQAFKHLLFLKMSQSVLLFSCIRKQD